MNDKFQLRSVFNRETVDLIAKLVSQVYPEFQDNKFKNYILPKLDSLSFGDRSSLITDGLYKFLPKEFEVTGKILLQSLGPEIKEADLSGYEGFYVMPMGSYVARYGKEHFELSMKLMYEMTKRFSSEGPIRTFIRLYPKKSLELLNIWSLDPNPHVRRLVSEGTRPRLPLTSPLSEFIDDPTPVINLLEKIKESPELFVRRSIANNLNDISKDNPDMVTSLLERWKNDDNSKDMQWLVRHALRTLLKQGNQNALELLGFFKSPDIKILNFTLQSKQIKIGKSLIFEFELYNQGEKKVSLMVDYLIHFMKHNGKMKPKVFKLSKKQITPKETLRFSKKHDITQLSTRRIYPGNHAVQLQINGELKDKIHFRVID